LDAARNLEREAPERALQFHRAAADKGDSDSMREVLVRGDEDESRLNRNRLLELGAWDKLEAAAGRLDESSPTRAAEIRANSRGAAGSRRRVMAEVHLSRQGKEPGQL
jgi:hypothetical protein